MRTIYGAVLLTCVLTAACGGDDDGASAPGRGSAACRDFQDAACDYASDRCHGIDRATCDAMFRGIECASDETASACADALDAAECGTARPECELIAVADRAPAIAACETLTGAFCDHNATCGGSSGDCAQVSAEMGVDCRQALSIDLRYEACLEALDMLSCGSPAPSACAEVVYVLPPIDPP